MQFGQFIEHKLLKYFSSKSYWKRGRETSSRPLFYFLKSLYKNKWSTPYF